MLNIPVPMDWFIVKKACLLNCCRFCFLCENLARSLFKFLKANAADPELYGFERKKISYIRIRLIVSTENCHQEVEDIHIIGSWKPS